MTAVPFPVVGALVPLVSAVVLWFLTGSSFALIGAVIAPLAVVGYYLDARRRARREERSRESAARRDAIARLRAEQSRVEAECAELCRLHPSIADIDLNPEWVPSRSGSTLVRVGLSSSGEPWLVDLSGGVAIEGAGPVADAIWASLTVHGSAQLGEVVVNGGDIRFPGGAWATRANGSSASVTIRCSESAVESVTVRGGLPDRSARNADDTSQADRVLARIDSESAGELAFSDRDRCARGIGLVGSSPFAVDLTTDTPHVLVAGRTGSGKSRLLTTLVADWAERFPPDDWGFVGIDFKGGATLSALAVLPHCLAVVTDLDTGIVDRVLTGIAAEMRRREGLLADIGVTRIEDASGLARLALVVDELPEFLRQRPDAHDLLADIARRGRSLGVHLVLVTQQPWGVVREAVLANIPVRMSLSANSPMEIAQVVGRPVAVIPPRGRALVSTGDGGVADVAVRVTAYSDLAAIAARYPPHRDEPPWRPPLVPPIRRDGREGFGLIDDVDASRHELARWAPADGDVLVVGARGSGRTTALHAVTRGLAADWVDDIRLIGSATSAIIVIDDLDAKLHELTPAEHLVFLAVLASVRARTPRVTLVVSARSPMPRVTGPMANMIALRLSTLDEHRATNEPAHTWERTAGGGSGSWRGKRVVVFADAD